MSVGVDEAKNILAKCLFVNPDDIEAEDVIAEIKPIDSLAFETIMLEVEEATGQPVEPHDVLQLQTVADLAKVIAGKTQP
ncbi:acyl carrier protein [Anderseniella sp. Alg231-50]|uniref:acyl carrier protein n=1 Tax=Anderseniella sp. Alg231-50 TaxID=1922226 RepID=UPI00307BC22B